LVVENDLGRSRVRTASGSDRIIYHLKFDIFHFSFAICRAAISGYLPMTNDPVATARGSDTTRAQRFYAPPKHRSAGCKPAKIKAEYLCANPSILAQLRIRRAKLIFDRKP